MKLIIEGRFLRNDKLVTGDIFNHGRPIARELVREMVDEKEQTLKNLDNNKMKSDLGGH